MDLVRSSISGLSRLFYGDGGETRWDVQGMTHRNRLSDHLLMNWYDDATGIYVLTDGYIGKMWEISTLPILFDSMAEDLVSSLLFLNVPEKSVAQFILYSDDYIDPKLLRYQQNKVRMNDITRTAMEHYCNHLRAGTRGLDQMLGTPVRDFRAFFNLKIPTQTKEAVDVMKLYSNVQIGLEGGALAPVQFGPQGMVDWLGRVYNDTADPYNYIYDDDKPLRKQIIKAETNIRDRGDRWHVGKSVWRATTPSAYPKFGDCLRQNELFGGMWGIRNDTDQLTHPFLYVFNIVFEDLKTIIQAKYNLIDQQRGVANWAPSLMRKKQEFLAAIDNMDRGERYFRIMPVLWVKGKDDEDADRALAQAKRVWQRQKYRMQDEQGILKPLWLASMPFGVRMEENFIEEVNRYFDHPSKAIARQLPVQTAPTGTWENPVMVFLNRKGGLFGFDLFTSTTNFNMLVAAASGSGKSFFMNSLIQNYYAAGAQIRCIDIGGSYLKLASMYKGRILDFAPSSDISLNPFTYMEAGVQAADKRHDEQRRKAERESDADARAEALKKAKEEWVKEREEEKPANQFPVIANLFAEMAVSTSSNPDETVSSVEMTILYDAVAACYAKYGPDAEAETVYDWLQNYDLTAADNLGLSEGQAISGGRARIVDAAHMLAYRMKFWRKGGSYGRFVNGKSTLNIEEDDFVLLELEAAKAQKPLFRVATAAVIEQVTRNLYLGDRSVKKLLPFDEMHLYYESGVKNIAPVIREGLRRIRKYNGSLIGITQSIRDPKKWGEFGDVILENTAFKALLQSDSYALARSEDVITYGTYDMDMLQSVRTAGQGADTRYSEIFLDTPYGRGPVRLCVDPFSSLLWSSKGDAYEMVRKGVKELLAAQGPDYGSDRAHIEVIEAIIARQKRGVLA